MTRKTEGKQSFKEIKEHIKEKCKDGFNLSNCLIGDWNDLADRTTYWVQDIHIKEFIKILKTWRSAEYPYCIMIPETELNKLAGDKLSDGKNGYYKLDLNKLEGEE